jgi:hypothetical protein
MSHLIDAYYNSGPDSAARRDAVVRRFDYLHRHGADLVSVEKLQSMPDAPKELQDTNHYVLAQIMRLTRPKRRKPFKLEKLPEGQVEAAGVNTEVTDAVKVIELGRYDCMVWFRYSTDFPDLEIRIV